MTKQLNIQDGLPNRPLMLWDGDCGFCFHWILRWKKLTGESVVYRSYQEMLEQFPQLDVAACNQAVHLVLPDGSVRAGAHAVITSLSVSGRMKWMLAVYERHGWFRKTMERLYRFVAENRSWLPGSRTKVRSTHCCPKQQIG
ncbi:MAG: DUF393 domain-containing protein [Pontiellaceae bacterium]|nr:DUF393 domain-containing protein [Pontiellaceae bacterium]MBN2786440.1 DUF393 domain-containing protein [Pontiellaceae bacterium]